MKLLLKLFHKVALSSPGKRWTALIDSLSRVVGPVIYQGTIVYERNAPPPETTPQEGLTFERHDNITSLEAALKNCWDDPRCEGLSDLEQYVDFFAGGAVAWIARLDGTVAQLRWTKAGKLLNGWYLRLAPDDLVFFGAVTLYGFRGRGIHGTMFRHVLANEPHRRAYGDVIPTNHTARRVLEKLSFKPLFKVQRAKSQLHPDTLAFHTTSEAVTLMPTDKRRKGSVAWHVNQLVKAGYWEYLGVHRESLGSIYGPKSSHVSGNCKSYMERMELEIEPTPRMVRAGAMVLLTEHDEAKIELAYAAMERARTKPPGWLFWKEDKPAVTAAPTPIMVAAGEEMLCTEATDVSPWEGARMLYISMEHVRRC